ncbi:MAG TPA: integrase domain-containing protein [Acidiferrobacterales bacterium]|nr:integrase domain-containing protein [Acidiferrobacterales bacterium]
MRERPIAAAYLQFLASVLRTYCTWIGKPGMVLPLERYVADAALLRRRYTASRDKSWSAKVLDIPLLIQQVCMLDIYVGIQLELMFRFGLRKKEAVCLRPHLQLIPASMVPGYELVAESYLMLVLEEGTKGGRLRFVPIDTDAKRSVLMRAQALVSHTRAHMGRPGHSLDQALRRFDYIMEKLGITMADLAITAHGLRHEYANDLYVELTGEHSPVRGGMPSDLRRHLAACLEVAKQLGHGRVQIARAYLGPLLRAARMNEPQGSVDARRD